MPQAPRTGVPRSISMNGPPGPGHMVMAPACTQAARQMAMCISRLSYGVLG